jgi:putative nucleotidyltransferase with HDIG domain
MQAAGLITQPDMTTVTTAGEKAAALIEGVRDLPTPPLVFAQIVKVVDHPDTSACEVGAIIAEDPAMTAKVLRITNSAFYGLSGTVNSVKQAVVIIGLDGVRSLVVSTSIIDMFKGDRFGREFQDLFWRHSLVTAFGSRMLMRILNPGDPGISEVAFSAGLLHDIGKMVMYLQDPERCHRIQEQCATQPTLELSAEKEAFGCTHAEVGEKITAKWNLPPELSRAISHHHEPLGCEDPTHLTDVVHVADALAYHALSDGSMEVSAPGIEPEVFQRSGLKLEAAGEYLETLKSEYVQAETFLNMARGAA